jgi:hypothetical protein
LLNHIQILGFWLDILWLHIKLDFQKLYWLYQIGPYTITSSLVLQCWLALQNLSQYNVLELFWVPGHSGVEGNGKVDELARMGSDSQFCGPEPCLALPTTVAKSKIKDWVTQSHFQNWRTIPGCKHSKWWLIQPSRKTALYFLGLSRIRLRMVLSLNTGHCRLNGHLSKMWLHSDPICGGFLPSSSRRGNSESLYMHMPKSGPNKTKSFRKADTGTYENLGIISFWYSEVHHVK